MCRQLVKWNTVVVKENTERELSEQSIEQSDAENSIDDAPSKKISI